MKTPLLDGIQKQALGPPVYYANVMERVNTPNFGGTFMPRSMVQDIVRESPYKDTKEFFRYVQEARPGNKFRSFKDGIIKLFRRSKPNVPPEMLNEWKAKAAQGMKPFQKAVADIAKSTTKAIKMNRNSSRHELIHWIRSKAGKVLDLSKVSPRKGLLNTIREEFIANRWAHKTKIPFWRSVRAIPGTIRSTRAHFPKIIKTLFTGKR